MRCRPIKHGLQVSLVLVTCFGLLFIYTAPPSPLTTSRRQLSQAQAQQVLQDPIKAAFTVSGEGLDSVSITRVTQLFAAIETSALEVGMEYSLAFGSLLGYGRNGNWTPWDDDFDVMIPFHTHTELAPFLAALSQRGVDHVRGYDTRATMWPLLDTQMEVLRAHLELRSCHEQNSTESESSSLLQPEPASGRLQEARLAEERARWERRPQRQQELAAGLTYVPYKLWLRDASDAFTGDNKHLRHRYPFVDVFFYVVLPGLGFNLYDQAGVSAGTLPAPFTSARVSFGPTVARAPPPSVTAALLDRMYGPGWCGRCMSPWYSHKAEAAVGDVAWGCGKTAPCGDVMAWFHQSLTCEVRDAGLTAGDPCARTQQRRRLRVAVPSVTAWRGSNAGP